MKYYSTIFSIAFLLLFSCSISDSNNSQEEELAILNQQKSTIEELAMSISCTDNSTCNYVAFGSKPCGGPWTYLAYNSEIDEELFLNNIAVYNANEEAYNLKWSIVSDCSAVMPPTSVECVDGKCTAIYN